MKVIRYAEVLCDDCGKAVRRMAAPHTKATTMAGKRLLRQARALAVSKRWSVEGPSAMAGDLCGPCNSVADLAHEFGGAS
jgi:hypothetical protein